MTLLNQEQLEIRMAEVGYAKTQASMAQAEAAGRADSNPYAATVYRDFVQPLADLVQKAQAVKGPAANAAHIALLRPLDPWAVAYLAVRVTMSTICASHDKVEATVRKLCSAIGKSVHSELYLTQFDELAPDLFFIIAQDLGRRKAKSAEHRVDTFKAQAAAKGMVFTEWGPGAKDQVGAWLLDQLVKLGMVEMELPKPGPGRRPPLSVYLHPDVADTIERMKHNFSLIRPQYGPCVEPPVPWTAWNEGGWHSKALRRMLPYPVKASGAARELLKDHSMPIVLDCLNALQAVKWRVNKRVFSVVEQISQLRNVGEIVLGEPEGKPAPPAWFATIGEDERTPEQEQEFLDWKARMTVWYTEAKLQRAAKQRFAATLRTVREYMPYPELYFVYFCDSRGRVYPMTQGISPQGSDVQKGVLEFAEGKWLDTQDAQRWFLYNGANLWGFDKATPQERIDWHLDKAELLLSFADDPIENQGWLDADNPVQFLAWCFEYAEWFRTGNVCSHLPVALDGSCSGLQHFSAMLRDEVGGAAVNLTYSPKMNDIYRAVAEVAQRAMEAAVPDEAGFRQAWLDHGINRSVTKRSVMTTSYGVTKRSAIRYVIDDYLRATDFIKPREHYSAAAYLMDFVWPAISAVVVKGKQAMSWLDKAGKQIIKDNGDVEGAITWVTPSGFLASQAYYEYEEHNVATKLYGHARIKVLVDSPEASPSRHSLGISPNFIHSMDASHLHLTTARMANEIPNVSLAMIHDSFGTHAADTGVLFNALRDEFVKMYQNNDPLQDFASKYKLPAPPAKGKLDLEEVRRSLYVFS